MSTWERIAVSLLGSAIELAPRVAEIIRRGVAASDSNDPLVVKVAAILPEEGASARAARELRGE